MDALLNLPSVTLHHDLRGLSRLYDSVEAKVRGLRALGVASEWRSADIYSDEQVSSF